MESGNNEPSQEDENSTSSSGEVIATNRDLTTEILLRLPATLVGSLKLVSKLWLSIISDPDFIRGHTLRHPLLPSGLFLYYIARPRCSARQYIPIDRTNIVGPWEFVAAQSSLGIYILQSCNGILLCCSFNHRSFYICNPSTLQRKQLALPFLDRASDIGLNLAFDPKTSLYYKVICVRTLFGQQSRHQVDVYSSETGLWRTVGEPFTEHNIIDFKRGVYCKGAVHWLKTTSSCLYFDIDEEIMRSTPEPHPGMPIPSNFLWYFGQSNGQLYLVVRWPLPNFTLLEMEDDYSGWSFKYWIDLMNLSLRHSSMLRSYPNTMLSNLLPRFECDVLCILKQANGDEEWEEIVLSTPSEIVYFNPYSKVMSPNFSKKIADMVPRPYDQSVWYRNFQFYEYIETLCPV